jgi:hypothetical protein
MRSAAQRRRGTAARPAPARRERRRTMLLKTTVRSAFCSAVSWSISALQSARTATPCTQRHAPPRRVLNVTHRHAVYSTSRIGTPCTQRHAPHRRVLNVTHRHAVYSTPRTAPPCTQRHAPPRRVLNVTHRHAVYSTSRTATPCTQRHAPPRRVLNVTHRHAARQATAKASRARERSAGAAAGSPSGRQPRARSRASADASGRPVSDGRFGVFVCLLVCLFVCSFADARRLRSRLCVAVRGLIGGYAHCVLSAARRLRLVVRCTRPAGGRDGDELQPTNACAGTDSATSAPGPSAHLGEPLREDLGRIVRGRRDAVAHMVRKLRVGERKPDERLLMMMTIIVTMARIRIRIRKSITKRYKKVPRKRLEGLSYNSLALFWAILGRSRFWAPPVPFLLRSAPLSDEPDTQRRQVRREGGRVARTAR